MRAVERIVPEINGGADPETALSRVRIPAGPSDTPASGAAAGHAESDDSASPDATPTDDATPSGDAAHAGGAPKKSVEMRQIEQRLIERLGTRVVLSGSNERGKIEIAYLSMDDLERVLDLIDPA